MTISTTKTDLHTAQKNRQAIEDGLAGGGKFELPSGLIAIDREVMIQADASFAQLTGQGIGRSVLKNLYDAGNYAYGLWVYGTEITPLTMVSLGTPLGDVTEGTLNIPAPTTFPSGTLVYVTQGLSYIDGQYQSAMTGEYRRVEQGNRFDRSLRRDYLAANRPDAVQAYAVPVQPVEGLLLADFTIAQPINNQASPLMSKYLYNCRFERVGFGLDGEVNQRSNTNTSAYVVFDGCQSTAALELNTSHDIRIVWSDLGGLRGEESCSDCLVQMADLCVSGNQWNGLDWTVGSDRLTAIGVNVYGGGQWYANGTQYPIRVTGRECSLRKVRDLYPVVVAAGWSACQIAGDRFVAEEFETPMPVQVLFGTEMVLNRCKSPAWDMRQSSGTATDTPNVPTGGVWVVRG